MSKHLLFSDKRTAVDEARPQTIMKLPALVWQNESLKMPIPDSWVGTWEEVTQ